MSYPVFSMIVGQASYSLSAGDRHHAYTWQNASPLIGVYQVRSGSKPVTQGGRKCLLFEAIRNDLTLIGATLGPPATQHRRYRAVPRTVASANSEQGVLTGPRGATSCSRSARVLND